MRGVCALKINQKNYSPAIITYILAFMAAIFWCLPIHAYASSESTEESCVIQSFSGLAEWLEEHKSSGGTAVLGSDITIPAGESYEYINSVYRKELTIDTAGHTIYVEGRLSLWPFLRVEGDGGARELFHVCPGGELNLISISVDAGESGTAVVQDNRAFFVCGSEKGLGLPAFSCTGRIVSPDKITAGAAFWYDYEKIPMVRIQENASFTEEMLPDTVDARVNREFGDNSESLAVAWNEESFPESQKRTIISGSFPDGYAPFSGYEPRCLVIWEAADAPFFLNAYVESYGGQYILHMYAETYVEGTVYIEYSSDGELWNQAGEDNGGEVFTVTEGGSMNWILHFSENEAGTGLPSYFRMIQILPDGTEVCSEILEITKDNLFVAPDIDGGRGGETSPSEGEDQLPALPAEEDAGEKLQYGESGSVSAGADHIVSDSDGGWNDRDEEQRNDRREANASETSPEENGEDTDIQYGRSLKKEKSSAREDSGIWRQAAAGSAAVLLILGISTGIIFARKRAGRKGRTF